jgi:TPP-dependent pyruvate/acetoin dehydrogenase alpha subunit
VQSEVDAAVEFGENSPLPDVSTLLTDVYTEMA